jgi:hypothetical protein
VKQKGSLSLQGFKLPLPLLCLLLLVLLSARADSLLPPIGRAAQAASFGLRAVAICAAVKPCTS